MVNLLLTEKGGDTKQLSFDKDEVTIGRVQGNDVVLPKGNVSKRHCRIMVQSGRFSVEDLKSTNGTYINGRKISESTSVSGTDKIYVGDFVIKVENAAGAEAGAGGGAAEAGSLSTALPPRRPPPPPAPGRATQTMRAMDEEALADAARLRSSRNLPPPPPARREPTPPISTPSSSDLGLDIPDLEVGSSRSAEVDMDEEALSPRPRLNVPPLRSPRPLTSDAEPDLLEEPPTAHRERGSGMRGLRPSPATAGPSGPPAAAEALATWMRDQLDNDVSAIYVRGSQMEIERGGQREQAKLPPDAAVQDAVRSLASRGSPRPAGDTRVINVLLPENARLAAIFPPVASDLSVTLQKLAPVGRTLEALVEAGSLAPEAREILEACVSTRRNILIGGDGRALDVLLEAVAGAIPSHMRVVCLAAGISGPETATWIKLATDTRVSDIVTAAASLRPDYLVVEVTAPPLATDVLGQCVLGQEGTIVAVAARSASDALHRLSALAGPALGGVAYARELAAAAFDVVLCGGTLADGSIRVLQLGEPRSDGSGPLEVTPLVTYTGNGGISGPFELSRGPSRIAATLGARGVSFPPGLAAD